MKNLLMILTLLAVQNISRGQKDTLVIIPKRNTIYIEAFGQGLINSLCYDRLFKIKDKIKTSFTVGVIIVPYGLFGIRNHSYGIPVSYNWLFGQKKNHLELGLGLTYLRNSHSEPWNGTIENYHIIYLTPKISYRLQNPKGGLFFRISLTPFMTLFEYIHWNDRRSYVNYFNNTTSLRFIYPWAGISLGYTLK